MSAVDRLDEIQADIPIAARSPEMARHFALDHGPELLAALRSVLDLHKAADWGDGHVTCSACWDPGTDGLRVYPCPTVRAATAALGEVTR